MSTNQSPTLSNHDIGRNLSELGHAVSAASAQDPGAAVFVPVEAVNLGARIGGIIVELGKQLLLLGARGIIVPFEALTRDEIGERYFNPLITLISIAIPITLSVMEFWNPIIGWVVAGLTVVLVGLRRLSCFLRDRRGEYWHSYSDGGSILRLPPIDEFLGRKYFTFDFSKLAIEPLAIAVVALIIHLTWHGERYPLPIGLSGEAVEVAIPALYFAVMSLSTFLYQLHCWHHRRQILLNQKDAMIVMQTSQQAAAPSDVLGIQTHRGVAYLPRHVQNPAVKQTGFLTSFVIWSASVVGKFFRITGLARVLPRA